MGSDAVGDLRGTDEWQDVEAQFRRLSEVHLRELFAQDPGRGTSMVARAGDLVLDYSKHRVDAGALAALPGDATRCSRASASTPRRTARCCT
jgi:glucose-6-phosphate isomerase